MKLKLDDNGNVVVQDGRPVYAHEDGKEVAFDAPGTVATISRLNAEAKGHREAKEAAEARLKDFDGIDDPESARAAIELARNIKDGDLVKAGKVEEIKAAAKRAAEEQVAAAAKSSATRIKELEENLNSRTSELYQEKIGGSFNRSKFISEKVAIPPDMVQARFGQSFKIEDGKIVAYDQSGNKVYSRARPGDIAEFDEALEIMIDAYPYKDSIMKGTGGSGTGKQPNGGPGGSGQKTLTREEFNGLGHVERAAKMKDGYKVIDAT